MRSAALASVLVLTCLTGCRADRQVTWDSTSTADAFEDVFVMIFLLGRKEGDRYLLEGPHAEGTGLDMEISARWAGDARDWQVTTMNPEIAEVVSVEPVLDEGIEDPAEDDFVGTLRVHLAFPREGSTTLYVKDGDGLILDAQPLHVHAPKSLTLASWDDVDANNPRYLDADVHLVPKSAASLAVTWLDRDGLALSGEGQLNVALHTDAGDLRADAFLAGRGVEAFTIRADGDAAPQIDELDLNYNDREVDRRRIVVHDPGDVTALVLETRLTEDGADEDEDGATRSGVVQADLFAQNSRIVGAPIRWFEGEDHDGTSIGTGTWAAFDDAEADESVVTACYQGVCDTVTVPGVVSYVGDATTDAYTDCGGCSSTGGLRSAAWMLPLLAVARRRARRLVPDRPGRERSRR